MAGSLVLAIPAHLAHHFLHGRVRSLVRDIEWAGNEIMRYLLIDYRRGEVVADSAETAVIAPSVKS
jgi:biopolymer transport protein ExbB